jgi:hypothetical protein
MSRSATYRFFIWLASAPALWCALAGAVAPRSPAVQPSTRPISEKPLLWAASDDEYAVYAAVLKYGFIERKEPVSDRAIDGTSATQPTAISIMIADRTIDVRLTEGLAPEKEEVFAPEGGDLFVPKKVAALAPEAASGFEQANRRPAKLEASRLRVDGLEIELATALGFYRVPRLESDRYGPHGLRQFTRVSFSKSGDQAIVSQSVRWSTTYAYGTIYVLERKKDGWHVILAERTFIT